VTKELERLGQISEIDQDARQRDRAAIQKIVKQLTSSQIAKLGTGSKSPVAEEVANAINALVTVSSIARMNHGPFAHWTSFSV
jgi:hypothetical protein